MTKIPIYFEAKQISAMTVTPEAVASDGTLTAGASVDLKVLGIFESLTGQFSHQLMEISSADAGIENHQPGKDTFTITLTSLDINGKVNPIVDEAMTAGILMVIATGTQYGTGGTAQKTLTAIGRIETFNTGWVEGKNVSSLTLRPCGVPVTWA